MRKFALIVLLLSSINVLSCEVVPIYRLVSNPELFDGKCVETVGVINVEFESWRLFTDRESYDYYVIENSIHHNFYPDYSGEINTKEVIDNFIKTYEGKLVRYRGLFRKGKGVSKLPSPTGTFEHIDITVLTKLDR